MTAVERLPDTIRVHGYDIRIVKWAAREANAAERYGEFSPREYTIRIAEDRAVPHGMVDTLLHEITHAIWWAYRIHAEKDSEERIVQALGSAWMQVYRDNPWLLDWIKETLHGGACIDGVLMESGDTFLFTKQSDPRNDGFCRVGETRRTLHPAPERDDLYAKIKAANAWFDSLTPEQQAAHREEQRKSWVRGEMGMGEK